MKQPPKVDTLPAEVEELLASGLLDEPASPEAERALLERLSNSIEARLAAEATQTRGAAMTEEDDWVLRAPLPLQPAEPVLLRPVALQSVPLKADPLLQARASDASTARSSAADGSNLDALSLQEIARAALTSQREQPTNRRGPSRDPNEDPERISHIEAVIQAPPVHLPAALGEISRLQHAAPGEPAANADAGSNSAKEAAPRPRHLPLWTTLSSLSVAAAALLALAWPSAEPEPQLASADSAAAEQSAVRPQASPVAIAAPEHGAGEHSGTGPASQSASMEPASKVLPVEVAQLPRASGPGAEGPLADPARPKAPSSGAARSDAPAKAKPASRAEEATPAELAAGESERVAAKPASAPEQALTPASRGSSEQAQPSIGAALGAVGTVLPAARACLAGQFEPSKADVVFGSDGRVRQVRISGPAAGTPAEKCLATALGQARVRPFTDETFSVRTTVRP